MVHNSQVVLTAFVVLAFSITFVGTAAADAPDCSTVSYTTDTDGALLVGNVDQLQCMNASLSADYRLANDIDATGTSTWNGGQGFKPVGSDELARFTGTLDGDGHVVTGLSINRSGDYIGLFGATDNATIRDLGIEGVSIKNDSATEVGSLVGLMNRSEVYGSYATGEISVDCCVGGLVAEVEVPNGAPSPSSGSTLENTYTDVDIEAPDCCAGGIFYWFKGGNITDSYAEGEVRSTNCCNGGLGSFFENDGNFRTELRNSYATGYVNSTGCCNGGFVAEIYDSGNGPVFVEDTYSTGDVSASESCCVGGYAEFIGDGVVIDDSYATGNVLKSETCCSGGFAAYITDTAVVKNSYATGNVNESDCCAGGFTGGVYDSAVVKNSFATGDVDGGTDCCVGGFFGDSGGSFPGTDRNVIRSVATGDVTESGGGYVGGFGGYVADINITESYSTGNAESSEDNVGGFVGFVTSGSVINKSYARGDATGNDTVGGFVGLLDDGTVDETYSVGVPTATSPDATNVGGFVGRDSTTTSTSVTATKDDGQEEPGFGGTEPSVPENVPPGAPISEKAHPAAEDDMMKTTGVGGTVKIQASGITDSYWDEEASGTSTSDGGTPLSTSQMTGGDAPTNMLGFDFTNTWATVTNDYPILRNSPDLSILEDEDDTEECMTRRSVSRGNEGEECPHENGISRGENPRDFDRGYDRGTSRRDRSRGSTRRRGRSR